jgi:hypothetical protein
VLQCVHMATDGGGRKDLRHDRVVSPAGAPGSLEAQPGAKPPCVCLVHMHHGRKENSY